MIFKIKKGNHYSNNFFFKLKNLLNFNHNKLYIVKFNSSCLYQMSNQDEYGINKLFGFSIGFHHKNSIRFGWSCIDNKILIHLYAYLDGKRVIKEIGFVDIDIEYKFLINKLNSKYYLKVLDESHNIIENSIKIKKNNIGYNLWPYFGGKFTAPKDIEIYMKKVI